MCLGRRRQSCTGTQCTCVYACIGTCYSYLYVGSYIPNTLYVPCQGHVAYLARPRLLYAEVCGLACCHLFLAREIMLVTT